MVQRSSIEDVGKSVVAAVVLGIYDE